MGYGGYSYEAHEAITSARATKPREEVFREIRVNSLMDPRGVKVRESRDSAAHPNSLAIVFALDVTGSMARVPVTVAQKELPGFMRGLLDLGVPDPQIMFVAVGDARSDSSPLQVGQFESEAQLMDKWLTSVHLESGGGGSNEESYELAAWWLATHTSTDCWEKRKRKGYVFFTGDEHPYPALVSRQVENVCGEVGCESIPTGEIFRRLREKYHVFFLMPPHALTYGLQDEWGRLLGAGAIQLRAGGTGGRDESGDVCEVAAAIVALSEGKVATLNELAEILTNKGFSRDRISAIVQSLTPWAATLGRDGGDQPAVSHPTTARERQSARRKS